MTPSRTTSPGRRASPGWLGVVVAVLLVVIAIVAGVLIANGTVPLTSRRSVDVDITLPQPVLPDAPAIPERPIVPPVDPRVGPAASPAAPG